MPVTCILNEEDSVRQLAAHCLTLVDSEHRLGVARGLVAMTLGTAGPSLKQATEILLRDRYTLVRLEGSLILTPKAGMPDGGRQITFGAQGDELITMVLAD